MTCRAQGHLICATCRPRVALCPTCRGSFLPEAGGHRLFFAERLLERVPVACAHSEAGCEVELVPGKMVSTLETSVRHLQC